MIVVEPNKEENQNGLDSPPTLVYVYISLGPSDNVIMGALYVGFVIVRNPQIFFLSADQLTK